MNVLFRGSCKSEISVFICLVNIFPTKDSLMRLTYIIYSFWLIFSQVKLTHSGSLCPFLTPFMGIITRRLRFVGRKNKNTIEFKTYFFPQHVDKLKANKTKRRGRMSMVNQVISSLQLKPQILSFYFFANSDFFIY